MWSKLSVNVSFFAVILAFIFQIIVTHDEFEDHLKCFVYCSNSDAVSNLAKECGRYEEGSFQHCSSKNHTACLIRVTGGSAIFSCATQEVADKCEREHEAGDAICQSCNESLCNTPDIAENLEAERPALGVKQCYKFTANRDRQVTIVNCPVPFKIYYKCYAVTDFDASTVDKGCVAVKSELEEDQIIVEMCETSKQSHYTACYMCNKDLCNLKNDSEPGAGFSDDKLNKLNISSNSRAYCPLILLMMLFVKLL